MQSLVACLFLCTFLSSMAHAQLTWSKSSYPLSSSQGDRADFTGDGFPDLIFFDGTGTTLPVLPNSGRGSFDPSRAFSTSQQGSIALLDFNRDGKTDVAACDGQNLVVLLGNGDGTLTASQTVPVSCTGVVAGDFNHDGNPDIAVTVNGAMNFGDNQVIVYLGDGNGGISGLIVNDNVNFTGYFGGVCFFQGLAQAADFTGDKIPSSACVLASYESRRRPRSTTQTAARKVVVQTSAHAHSPPFSRAPSFSRPRGRGRTSPLPRGVAVAATLTPRTPYSQTKLAETPGAGHSLVIIIIGSFSPEPLGWFSTTKFTRG